MVGWVSVISGDGFGGMMLRVERGAPPAASCLPAHGPVQDQRADRPQRDITVWGVAAVAPGVVHDARVDSPRGAKPRRRAVSMCGGWLYVEGVGRPRCDLPAAQGRLMARRAAEVDAMRNLARAHGTDRTPPFRIILSEELSDGSVRVVVQSRAPRRKTP